MTLSRVRDILYKVSLLIANSHDLGVVFGSSNFVYYTSDFYPNTSLKNTLLRVKNRQSIR